MIILFPSTAANAEVGNESGCWNVFGFLDDLNDNVYASREAKQVRTERTFMVYGVSAETYYFGRNTDVEESSWTPRLIA